MENTVGVARESKGQRDVGVTIKGDRKGPWDRNVPYLHCININILVVIRSLIIGKLYICILVGNLLYKQLKIHNICTHIQSVAKCL